MLGVGQFFDDLKEGYQTPSFSCLLSRKFSPLPIFHVFQVELKLGTSCAEVFCLFLPLSSSATDGETMIPTFSDLKCKS